jgi:hypothetical protein
MPDLTFDFTWFKDTKGYRLVPAKLQKRRPGVSFLDHASAAVAPARIVRNGGTLQSYRPLDDFDTLFRRFLKLAKSESGVLEFVENFGPLTYEGLKGKGDVVPQVIDWAEDMDQVLRGRIVALPLNKLNVSIVNDRNYIHLKIKPTCLLDALWLQLAQTKSSGRASPKKCEQCRELFMAGVDGTRRADARFCSEQCRIKYHSRERSR